MTGLEYLERDYRAAFLRYLPRRDEAALHTGYEIGRSAVRQGRSILDLTQVHHQVLLEVLRDIHGEDDLNRIAVAASEFLIEVLASHDMVARTVLPET